MRDIKIALVQCNQYWEDKSKNLAQYENILASIEQVDLIVFPEMFQTGFSMNADDLAEEYNASASIDWLRFQSRTKSAAIYTSLIIEEGGAFFNRGVFVQPNGEVQFYDKRKSFGLAGEDKVFTAGNRQVIVEFEGWKIQLQICYDLRFPEISRNRIDSNGLPCYDVLMYVANWPEKRKEHWKALLTARAIENQCYVLGVNRIGLDGKGLAYSGDSLMVNALGESIACRPNEEEVLLVELSATNLIQIRQVLPFLKDM